ncbi:MAG: hypothetical protein P4L40_01875, partial [Terracidiphilus sp.]|nr:hypothetical protein [Terracidiphilus sp.]
YGEFTEALVRCALVAYSKISDASLIDKIRGLFLYMWRSVNKGITRSTDISRTSSAYVVDVRQMLLC